MKRIILDISDEDAYGDDEWREKLIGHVVTVRNMKPCLNKKVKGYVYCDTDFPDGDYRYFYAVLLGTL